MHLDVVLVPLWSRKKEIVGFTQVDAADVHLVIFETWYLNTGYASFNRNWQGQRCKTFWLHRVITEAPDELEVDHQNLDRLDNRRSNLRKCTHSQNNTNKKRQSNNSSGFKGVSWHNQDELWRARINVNGKAVLLGLFSNLEDAARAYAEAALRLHGEYARVS
jgi:hypothetical protein